MKITNSTGSRTEPWGTPLKINPTRYNFNLSNSLFPIFLQSICRLIHFLYYFLIQFNERIILCYDCQSVKTKIFNLWKNRYRGTISKVLSNTHFPIYQIFYFLLEKFGWRKIDDPGLLFKVENLSTWLNLTHVLGRRLIQHSTF